MNLILTSWFSTYFKWTLVTLYVKTKTKTCCKHNYPSPDGSDILLGRGSTQEIERTAGNSSKKNTTIY